MIERAGGGRLKVVKATSNDKGWGGHVNSRSERERGEVDGGG